MSARFSIRHSAFGIRSADISGEVGDLILVISRFGGVGDEFVVHVAGEVFIHVKFLCVELRVERGVFFVDDFVAGQMLTAQGGGFGERRAPNVYRLAGNGEHEVDIQVIEAGLAQSVEGFENHFAAVDAAKAVEEFFIERLDTHGDAIDAETAQELGFIQRDRGRIAFHGEFFSPEQAESLHGAENLFPLAQVEDGRRAAAEKNGARFQVRRDEFQLTCERADVALDEVAAGRLREEGAIFAFLRAKRYVDVQALDGGYRHVGIIDRCPLGNQRKRRTTCTTYQLDPWTGPLLLCGCGLIRLDRRIEPFYVLSF